MKAAVNGFLISLLLLICSYSSAQSRDYYELRIYHCSSNDQIERLDNYLENTFLPLLHRNGLDKVGVFKDPSSDTSEHKPVFILIPGQSLSQLETISDLMVGKKQHMGKGTDYLSTAHDKPVFDRVEISWLRAFELHPEINVPTLSGDTKDHIFELRSYEAASELLYRKKVDMFNAGGEIDLFESLGFNAVFYAETLTGKHTPNLWYMTSHDNADAREKNWDAFRVDPRWDKMKNLPKYQNTVSHIDLYLLKATEYSDIK